MSKRRIYKQIPLSHRLDNVSGVLWQPSKNMIHIFEISDLI